MSDYRPHESEARRVAERSYELVTPEEWALVSRGSVKSLRGKMRLALLDMKKTSDLRVVKIQLRGNERPHDLQRDARALGLEVRGLVRDGWFYIARKEKGRV